MMRAYWSCSLTSMQETARCFFWVGFFSSDLMGFLFLIILSKYSSLGQLNFPISLNFSLIQMCLSSGRSSCRYLGMLLRVGRTTVFHSCPSQYLGRGSRFIIRSSSIIIILLMQTFKQISYQNYIELRFNQKNLDETAQQEALLKYKRNAQLLAEIFSFQNKPRETHEVTPVITQQHLDELEKQIEKEKMAGELKCKQIEENSKAYAHFLKSIKEMKSPEEKQAIIQKLKEANMYDSEHPYFAEGSPFFLASVDEEVLEVLEGAKEVNLEGLSILEINFKFMGNKILGKRSRSFYRGFNERQLDYLQQKFETIATDGVLDKEKFKKSYRITETICSMFFREVDFDEDSSIDEYEFICAVHSLCSCSIEELGAIFFRMLTQGGKRLDEKSLLLFTATCLKYNGYLEKRDVKDIEIKAENQHKFNKFDFDKNGVFDQAEFTKICLKDEDYKKWMYNMGFITHRQLEFQEDVYDLVDSDIADEVDRHQKIPNENFDKIKRGIEHRLEDDEFGVVEEQGEQSANTQRPWKMAIRKCKTGQQNMESPSQTLEIDYVFGYRSYDCRNNVKFDSKGKIIYHQAAIGIVLDPKTKNQIFITEHHDDISCLDVVENSAVTGEVGSSPSIIMWETDSGLDGALNKKFVVTAELKNSVGNICLSHTRSFMAAVCNDEDHSLIVYDCKLLLEKQDKPLMKGNGVVASGTLTKNIVFDIRFALNETRVAVATLREIMFVTFGNGKLNANRGDFGNFTVSGAMCLLPLECQINQSKKQMMLSGMGNGSVYFWEDEICVRAVCGHTGSVSALAVRKDCKSFISGDKSGLIIIWNAQLKKERSVSVPKTNCPSNMIVSLSANANKEILVGTKSSDIYLLGLNDEFENAKKMMSGHNDGTLNAMALHKTEPHLYTGGDDKRLIKWDYAKKRAIVKEKKCPFPIRTLALHSQKNMLLVGYTNGVIESFNADTLQKTEPSYRVIKNPDEEALNLIKVSRDGSLCAACYQLPEFKIILLELSDTKMKVLSEIKDVTCKVIALDFDRDNKYLRINTSNFEFITYDLKDPKKPTKIKPESYPSVEWATHSVPFSPETQGLMTDGVSEEDIICCDRSRKYKNVFAVGDKYSKIKLFNYPSVKNPIFSRYVGHSNEVTGLEFSRDEGYLVSIGGEEKSIIVWKYDPVLSKNQWFIDKLEPESQIEEKEIDQMKKTNAAMFDEFAVETEQGEQAMSTKPFLGQIRAPSDFETNYNPRKDNVLPSQEISIRHVFGLRNKYLNDDVRNQCKFSSSYKEILFPTACLAVKMSIEDRNQQIYHEHKEDIVSFAIDDRRQLMATGQMAEKNPYAPRKKILAVYVWDIEGKKMLQKLDGFHTIAVVLLAFSPNSKLLFTCGNDDKNTFAVYDWMSGSIMYTGPTSRAKVNGIAWKNDSEFATCGMDHVKFWTGNKGMLGKIDGKTEGMFSVVSSKAVYITGSGEGGIFNWMGNKSSKKIEAHKGKVNTLVVFKDYVYSGGDDGKILAWRVEANGEIRKCENFFDTRMAFQQMSKEVKIEQEEFGVLSIDFSPKKDVLVATKGASVIYKSASGAEVIHQGHYKGELWGLTTNISRGGDNLIITAGDDKTVRVWDLNQKRQVNRLYLNNKVRGIDWSSDGDKVAVADARAQVFLYNIAKDQLVLRKEYTGKPFDFNKGAKIDPWVEDIKFSPNNQMLAYGCHGKSMYMETLNVKGNDLSLRKAFPSGGSSALLHLDWSVDSSTLSINTQDYSLLFLTSEGDKSTATGNRDTRWKTWTQKLGFPVQGVFQGVDYTDVNTVCRDPTERYLAVGYDDQCIRLFKWPCYIEKQVCKTYSGHSSHVTRIRFTKSKMVSLGGLDRTIIVWDIQDDQMMMMKSKAIIDEEQDDGLDDLDEDVDIPNKALRKAAKPKAPEEFYEVEDEGDQFMAIKPWLGAIKEPTYKYPQQTKKAPKVSIELEYVHGYRCKDARQNLYYGDKDTLIFHAAAVVIQHSISRNEQVLDTTHDDDILSIDYHKASNQIITGQLGPKPMVCLYQNGKLAKTFPSPVTKGVIAIAISPDGRKAACAGMDDDHHIAVLNLQSGAIIKRVKGTKKVIMKIVWANDSQFATVGIKLYKYWTLSGKDLTGKECRDRGNFVSVAFDPDSQSILTGESKGVVKLWKATNCTQTINLKLPTKGEKEEEKSASVVDALLVQKDYYLAGTKDGYIFVLGKKGDVLNILDMKKQFQNSDVPSECPSVRAMDIVDRKLVVGTLGSEIYEFEFDDLTKKVKKFKSCKNILKSHYSPNNTWTNEVWGLYVTGDYIFTCSDDATVRCWSIANRKLLSCASLNVNPDGNPLSKDKKTNDYSEAAKGRAVAVSPDMKTVIVGCKNGTVREYSFDQSNDSMKFKNMFRHAKEWISDIKFAYNTLIIGSHDNALYVYDYVDGKITRRCKPLKKHSSYITHFDVSRDSCFMQSTCGAYELLFWDLSSGKQITSGATMLRDERWASWTCNLGWPVQGIYPKCTDGTFINAVDRSNFSINGTRYQDEEEKEHKSPYILAAGNDSGKVALYNFPTTIKSSDFVEGRGHSSHVTSVRWSPDDSRLISVGGEDQCLMYWKVGRGK